MVGLLKKIQAWGEKQTTKAEALNKKIQDSANTRAEADLNKFLTAEGIKKQQYKNVLMQHTLVYPTFKVDYIGGHYEAPEGKEDINVMLIPCGIILKDIEDIISYTEIKDIQFKTESEVQSDVTLTRMVAFGVYALAMKKKKKVVTNYLILNCEHGGMKYSMAFAGDDVSMLYKELFKKVANQ